MKRARLNKTMLIFIILISSFIFLIVKGEPDTEDLYVDGFNSILEEWDETGASPWLQNNQETGISTSVDEEWHEEFTFADGFGSGTINSVYLWIEVKGPSARNDKFMIYLWGESGGKKGTIEWILVAELDSDDDAYTWYNYDVSTICDTWANIDGAKLKIQYQKVGSPATQTIYARRSYLLVDYSAIPSITVTHDSLESNQSQIDDYEKFYLNITFTISPNSENFSRNVLTLDPGGLGLNITYLNGTGFSELNDVNNYISLDIPNSNKTDISTTQIYLKYVLSIHHSITKEGWFDVYSFSNETYEGKNDSDTYSNVFNLTLRSPTSDPDYLYGAGFNASDAFTELYWQHDGLLTTDYEVQNSSDKVSWILRGIPSTTFYNDTSVENGTKRYYRVRARRLTGVGYKNSSFTDINFEIVYFIKGINGDGDIFIESDFPWIAIAIALSIIVLLASWLYHGDK